jgi:type I restriction enzyme S subunit
MTPASYVAFGDLFDIPLRNGLTRPKSVRGAGTLMVNMGEIFAYNRIAGVPMERVLLSARETESCLLQPGDLLFARQSLMLEGAGKCSIFLGCSEPVTFESHIIRVHLKSSTADPLFYYYYYSSPKGRATMASIVQQVSAAGIRGSDLTRLEVPWLPIIEQHAIARILGTLDDKIESNRCMTETLERMVLARFKSWFIDFDPVLAKSMGGATCLPQTISVSLPDSFEESPMGSVPTGWKVVSLGELVSFVKGKKPRDASPKPEAGLQPVILIDSMNGGACSYAHSDGMTVAAEDDVMMVMDGASSGRVNVGMSGIVGSTIAKVVPRQSDLGKRYLYCTCRLLEAEARTHLTGTSIPHADKRWFLQQLVCFPLRGNILAAFERFAGTALHRANASRKESLALGEMRDFLLSKLMSGELRIKDAERFVREMVS